MSGQSIRNAPDFGGFKFLTKSLSTDQLAGIRSAIGADQEISVSPTLATVIGKQIDSIRRMSEDRNRAGLEAVVRGTKVDWDAAKSHFSGDLDMKALNSKDGRHVWTDTEEKELLRLLEDKSYRLQALGDAKLDYHRLGEHFHRSESAVRKKCWSMAMKKEVRKEREKDKEDQMDCATEATIPEATVSLPQTITTAKTIPATKIPTTTHSKNKACKRRWNAEENEEMQKFVESEAYRIERGVQEKGSASIKWGKLAKCFKECKAGQAQKKFQSLKTLLSTNGGVVKKDRKQNRKHHQKKVAYKWMIVTVMRNFAGRRGTAPEIFAAIEAHDDFRDQLDMSIAPGTQQVPRWRTQVRKTLSAEKIFVNTGAKVNKETVWELDMDLVADLVADNPKQRIGDLSNVVPMMTGLGDGKNG